MQDPIIIIGAGIAGLSAGIYLQRNGYRTAIYEQHVLPGGVCTGWYKQGYYIDGCIHWLMGTRPGTGYHRMWQELEALKDVPVMQPDILTSIQLSNGRVFEITRDRERFFRELAELGPEDHRALDALDQALRKMAKAEVFFEKPREIAGFLDGLRSLRQLGPALPVFARYGKLSVDEWLSTFKSPLIREVLRDLMGIGEFAAISALTTLNQFFTGNSGIPQGGSLAFARRLAKRYQALGGELHLNQPVNRIVVEGGLATGIELEDQRVIPASRVVSAADGHVTYRRFLAGTPMSPELERFYAETPPFRPLVIVSFGATDQLEDMPSVRSVPLAQPLDVGGAQATRIKVRTHHGDPTLNQRKGATLQVSLFADWDYWHALHSDPEAYAARKEQVGRDVHAAILAHFPQLEGRLTCIDVATPKTFAHFTSVWRGAFEGWMLTPKSLRASIKKQVHGLGNVYHIGQWTTPGGGVPIAAKDGRDLARILCHQDRRTFTA